jgi:hypothetical protein
MPLRNPFADKNRYTESEFNQIEALQRYYTQDVNKDLHEFLQMTEDDHIPRYAATNTDLERCVFQSRLGAGPLAMEAENLLVNVLQYQRGRHNRDAFHNGYLNDPRNLLCEVIKHFAVDTLSHAEINPAILETLDKWIKFIHHVTMADIFRAGTRSEETMEAMLVGLRNSMRYHIRPLIIKELSCSSSREHLRWFIQNAKRVLSHGVQFLYFVLRNTENTPSNCTIPNIQVGQRPLDRVLNTYSGRLLQAMVLSTPFQEVFPIGYVPGGLSNIAEEILQANINSFGIAEGGKVIIPPILAQIVHDEREKERLKNAKKKNSEQALAHPQIREIYPHVFLQGPLSGIAKPFREKRELLEEYVRLHELFIKMAGLIQLLEQAHALAGEGGDLLVYGITRKHVAGLVVDYTLLANAVRDCIYIIEQHADGLYQHLVRENKPYHLIWKRNYLQVSNISMLLHEDLELCHQAAYRVRQQATQYALTMRQRIEQLKGNLQHFVEDADGFSRDLRTMLHLKGAAQADELLDAEMPRYSLESAYHIQFNSLSDADDDSARVTYLEDEEELPALPPIQQQSGGSLKSLPKITSQPQPVMVAKPQPSKPVSQSKTASVPKEVAKPIPAPAPNFNSSSKADTKRVSAGSVVPPSEPKKGPQILRICPGGQPLQGKPTRVEGIGFDEKITVKVGNVTIDGAYVQNDGDIQVITFRTPRVNTPGQRPLLVTNPDGSSADGIIVYFESE